MDRSPFGRLPDELCQRILRFLCAPHRFSNARAAWRATCRRARQQANATVDRLVLISPVRYLEFAHIARAFPALQSVSLGRPRLGRAAYPNPSNGDVAHVLARCPDLRSLEIQGGDWAPVTGDCLYILAGCALTRLELTRLKLDGFFGCQAQPPQLPQLQKLVLRACTAARPLPWLTPALLPQLRALTIVKSAVDAGALAALTQLTFLELDVAATADVPALADAVRSLASLRELHLRIGQRADSIDLGALTALTALTATDMCVTGLPGGLRDVRLRNVRPWPQLPPSVLSLTCADMELPTAVFERVSKLPAVECFHLANCDFEVPDLAHLVNAPALLIVRVNNEDVASMRSIVSALNTYLSKRGGYAL